MSGDYEPFDDLTDFDDYEWEWIDDPIDDIFDNLSLCFRCEDKYTDSNTGLCNDCLRQDMIDKGEGMEGF